MPATIVALSTPEPFSFKPSTSVPRTFSSTIRSTTNLNTTPSSTVLSKSRSTIGDYYSARYLFLKFIIFALSIARSVVCCFNIYIPCCDVYYFIRLSILRLTKLVKFFLLKSTDGCFYRLVLIQNNQIIEVRIIFTSSAR